MKGVLQSLKFIASIILMLLVCANSFALIPANNKIRLTSSWNFIREDMGSIWEVIRDYKPDSPESVPIWSKVNLPHCFNYEDAVDPKVNYYQGVGWYKKEIEIKKVYDQGRIFLEFEGSGQETEVYLYDRLVGKHIGGYDEWAVDITDAVREFKTKEVCLKRYKGKIPIEIRCDNSRSTERIPSDMSDFNIYGGLYRYVNLVYLPKSYIDSIKIQPRLEDNGKTGKIKLSLGIETAQEVGLDICVNNANSKNLFHKKIDSVIGDKELEITINNPILWSPDNPYLYNCTVDLIVGNDTVSTKEEFGFRTFQFQDNGPFLLNGKRLLLRGTHRHEDHAGVSAAMTEEMMIREMKQIKAMGANFIRLSHYQQSSIILRLCDRLGLLVWEEIPWCRGGLGGNDYKNQARSMLSNMINQHFNHPSIILWGLGNEIDWPGDFPEYDKDKIRDFMKELNGISHKLDPSRKTVIRRCDFCKDIVDVYSPSIWSGWYSKKFKDYHSMALDAFKSVPHFIHAEWGGDSHAGRHSELPRGKQDFGEIVAADKTGDWSESYIVDLFDWSLKEQENMPWLTGSLFWTFKDFSTPLRPNNPIPYVNQKGVVERDGTPKESYYVFQSYWSNTPMIHIYGHNWPVRWGEKNEEKQILVYSNCKNVELFVNGKSCGVKSRDTQDYPAAGFHWNVIYHKGNNTIKAIGRDGHSIIEDEISQDYQIKKWGSPYKIRIKRIDSMLLEAEIVDKNGNRCLDSQDWISFTSTDSKCLNINQGTSTGSSYIQAANGKARIALKCNMTDVVVCAQCKGLKFDKAFIRL